MRLICFLFLALYVSAVPQPPAIIPAAQGNTLDGRAIMLPRDLPARATVLILGFTEHSRDATTAWEVPVRTSLATTPAIGFYDMPFLEDAPAFIRPMIVRSIRKQVPDPIKPNFLPLTSNQTAWKQAVGFTSAKPDAAYIVLVDKTGAIHWQTHEAFTPVLFSQLSAEARRLAATP